MLFENNAQTVDANIGPNSHRLKRSLLKSLLKRSDSNDRKWFKLRRPEFYLAQTASLEAWPFGNTLMLLMKPPTAQGGSALSFPHQGITKVADRTHAVPLPGSIRGEPGRFLPGGD
jgi:hypothetical protein